jgi:hypothetical protein
MPLDRVPELHVFVERLPGTLTSAEEVERYRQDYRRVLRFVSAGASHG